MGLLTSLALMFTPLAKRSPTPWPTPTENRLRREIESLHKEIETISGERGRWEALAHAWRARYEMVEQAQSMQQAMQHYLNYNAQNPSLAYQQSLHAQQMMRQNPGLAYQNHCNCVPARHDALLGGVNA